MKLALTITAALLVCSAVASAQEPAEPTPVDAENDPVELAVERGIGFVLSQQNDDGSFGNERRHVVAMTSLSLMSLLATGHLPTDPTPQGRAMERAISFILRDDLQTPEGYFGDSDGSRMYGHGITTLLLSELLGMTGSEEADAAVLRKLEKAVGLILRSQQVPKYAERFNGGWRYSPGARDSDLSVTVWQVMALRSAKEAGLEVPAASIEQAVAYLKRSFLEARRAPGGVFSYQPGMMQAGYSQTAAGLLALQVCGEYNAPEVEAATEWLLAKPLEARENWFFYGTYYYAQGMHQRQGETAELATQRVREALLPIQNGDGSWYGVGQAADRVYATNMALLSLSVRYHYLPIYQR